MVVRFLYLGFIILTLLWITGCALNPHSSEASKQKAQHLAKNAGFKHAYVQTKFKFTTYSKLTNEYQPIRIYIEGDGHSRLSRNRVSLDPTPKNPIALKLALLDPHPNVVYLARPCQYTPHTEDPTCQPAIWSSLRYSETIVAAMNEAIEKIKQQTKIKEIQLVGFSGGGAIATLIAARRKDIANLRTVAGDLDHLAMSAHHKTKPLTDFLNPLQASAQLTKLPQHHFAGNQDKAVPAFISENFIKALTAQGTTCARRTVLENMTHDGWEKAWPALLTLPIECHTLSSS